MASTQPDPAIEGCVVSLRRCQAIIDQLTPDQYTHQPPGHSSIGEHIRHLLDHFNCLFRGLETGLCDYDARERNPELEAEPGMARSAIDEIISRLEALGDRALDTGLPFCCEIAPNRGRTTLPSTRARELAWLSAHTIHHVAIMVTLANLCGIEMPHGIGLAYSTETYWKSQGR
jgi:hypothetical protein